MLAVVIAAAVSVNAVQYLDAAAETITLATPAAEVTLLTCGEDVEEEVTPPYPVPLDIELQNYVIQLCEEYHIDPALVFAMIERESNYDPASTGDDGDAHGLMQIQPRWHQERMERLGCSDMYDPYENVTVGIDLMAELLGEYETAEMALMVYNGGPTGANTYWFSKEIYSNDYSRTVLTIAERLKGADAWQEY